MGEEEKEEEKEEEDEEDEEINKKPRSRNGTKRNETNEKHLVVKYLASPRV